MLLFWEPDSRLRLLPEDGVDPGYFGFREPQHRDYHELSKSGDKDMATAQHHSGWFAPRHVDNEAWHDTQQRYRPDYLPHEPQHASSS